MYIHNLDPILFDFGIVVIRWYSLAYIFGILIGWWYGKKIVLKKSLIGKNYFETDKFDDLITYLIVSIIIGGRIYIRCIYINRDIHHLHSRIY